MFFPLMDPHVGSRSRTKMEASLRGKRARRIGLADACLRSVSKDSPWALLSSANNTVC